jgi:hypothetical protein
MLSLKEGQHDKAQELIAALMDEVGPVAEVLDTRGVIHLRAGRALDAARDFQAAVKQDPAAAKYFHLALAHHAAGERLAARTSLARARGKGLKDQLLHPLERAAFKELAAELAAE